MKTLFLGVTLSFLIQCSFGAQTNEWTKATSGNWEESAWSLGQLPSASQDAVVIGNAGWKAVAIGQNTTAHFPQTLTLNNLLIDAPTNGFNTLLLNWALLNVPLTVNSNFVVGTNGALVSHYSALRATSACVSGSASFMDYAIEDFGQLWLNAGGNIGLTNGVMTCSNLTFYNGTFTQSGGTHTAQTMNVPRTYSQYSWAYGDYNLQGGVLISQQLNLGYIMAPFGANGDGFIIQTGGVHTNTAMTMNGYFHPGGGMYDGVYELQGGLLVTSNLMSEGGYFLQTGGTSIIRELDVRGGSYFGLSGGELIISNAVARVDTYVSGRCEQTGGKQTVTGQLLVQGGGYGGLWADPEYRLAGGSLTASNLQVTYGTLSVVSNAVLVTSNINLQGMLRLTDHAVVSNAGVIAVSGKTYPGYLAALSIDAQNLAGTEYLGQLQISGGCTLQYYAPSNDSAVRFADSHTQPWTGALQIWLQGPSPGAHIFFGTNAQGLSAAQLDQVQFMLNGQSGPTNFAAMLLPTGELVPQGPPPMCYTNCGHALVLSWPGGCELLTATNPVGPYEPVPAATSPFTNTFNEPQRFFRLHLPGR